MALSRILSQSLPRSFLCSPSALFTHHRHRSNKSHYAELIEVEIDHSSSSQTDSPDEVINFGIRKLEDAIHNIIVRRSAPDWLPFLPGYSYWVPPHASTARPLHPTNNMIEALGKIASLRMGRDRADVSDRSLSHDLLSEDEQLAFTSSNGWPSSTFYIEGTLTIPSNEDRANDPSDIEDEEE